MASKSKQMSMVEFSGKLETLIRDAVQYQEQLSPDRIKAVNYYNGKMDDMPPRKNWSSAVSRDLRAVMSKAMPAVLRTILGSDKVVEYQPVGPNDEESAEQATDYINQYVMAESGATEAIHDAVHDAFLLRNGVLHWFIDEKTQVEGSEHRDLNEMALAELVAGDDVEVLEQSTRVEMQEPDADQAAQMQAQGLPAPQVMPVELYTVKIKRTVKDRKPRLVSVPLDEFLISSDALCIQDARLVGQSRKVSRSDLVAMGYDRALINSLPVASENLYSEAERYSRRRYKVDEKSSDDDKQTEKIDYYDLFVRVDYDGDGIAEVRHVCMAGGFSEQNILMNDYASDAPYSDVKSERTPHQWEGVSLADDVIEIQRIKTALLRYLMDNIYWQNTRQPIVRSGDIENPEALLQPEFGRPIMLSSKAGPANQAVAYNEVPLIAAPILEAIQYWDGQASERTGIDDASAGLPPDALQNVTAKASALLEQKGIARVEMLVRTAATGGLKDAFRGLLKLTIENQDKARTVRLRDQWVDVDPRSWNVDMDATVNTGLGAGTRERDMMVMQGIMAIQEKMLAGFGPDNPFVKPDNVWAAISGLVEASGLRTPTMYFTKPDPQEVEAALKAKREAKPIELQKIEAEAMAKAELLKATIPMEVEKERIKVEAATQKEIAQGKAAVEERQAIAQIEAGAKKEELALKKYEIDQKLAVEREKMQLEIAKAHADAIGKQVVGLNDAAGKGVENSGLMLLDALHSIKNPPKSKPRKLRIVRDENGDMTGAEEVEEEEAA